MRTKTKETKITAIFIVLTMLMSISTGIMANEPEQDYVVTYQAEEITDTDTLIEMALEQPKSNARSATVSDGQLEVTQLLEIREYANGDVEEDKVSTIFAGVYESGERVNASEFAESRAAISDTLESSGSNGSVSVTQQLYYKHEFTMGGYETFVIKTNKAVVAYKNPADTVKIDSWYRWDYDIATPYGPYQSSLTSNASTGVWYTKTYNVTCNTHPYFGGASAGMTFTINNSRIIDTAIMCEKLM